MPVNSSTITLNAALLGALANDAAAVTGRAAVGQLYRNGSALMVRMA
jgi:hypothetical protein